MSFTLPEPQPAPAYTLTLSGAEVAALINILNGDGDISVLRLDNDLVYEIADALDSAREEAHGRIGG